MITDYRDLALIGELTDSESDLFRLACQTLLSRSFIMRGTESSDALWDFTIRNIRALEAWFSCADISLKRDELLGVVSMRPVPALRAKLGKEETCALLVARLLFEEKRVELSLSRFPSVRIFDFVQRYRAVTGLDLKKTRLAEILRSFARWRLVEASGDLDDPETPLALLPSIAMTLDQEGVDEIAGALGNGEGLETQNVAGDEDIEEIEEGDGE